MKISFSTRANDDAARQFRYYLWDADAPAIAVHFENAVARTIEALQRHSRLGVACPTPKYPTLRS